MKRKWLRSVSERGSVSVELVIIVPALLLVIGLLVAAGRMANTQNMVQSAAAAAARDASLSRSEATARTRATSTAAANLTANRLNCLDRSITVDTREFQRLLGQAGVVTVTVTCSVPLSDAGLFGVSGTKLITAVAASPVDSYRERS